MHTSSQFEKYVGILREVSFSLIKLRNARTKKPKTIVMKICRRCGEPNEIKAVFCWTCEASLILAPEQFLELQEQ